MKKRLKAYRTRFIFIICAIVFRQLLLVFAQQLNASVFDQLTDKNINQFFIILFSMVGIWVGIIGLDALLSIKEEDIILDIQQSIRNDVSHKLVFADYGEVQLRSTGTYLSWLNNDVAIISQKGIKQLFNIVRGISGVIFAGLLMVQYHWSLLIVTGIGFISMFYVPRLFDKRVYEVSQEVSKGNETFVSSLEDQINGYPIYFAFSLLPQFVKKINLISIALKKVMMKQIKLDAYMVAVNFSINVFFQILLTLIAAICYFNGWVPIGVVAIVGSLADIIFSGLGSVSYQVTSIKSVKPIFDKYDTLKAETRDIQATNENTIYEADKLSLSYEKELIFKDLSFIIYPNNKCLISGASGSGKSSLVKLLLGYNTEFMGDLRYKGKDVKNLSSKTIAKDVFYLSQQSYVFRGTIRENIQLGDNFSDEQLLGYLSLVGFDNIDSVLDADTSQLSGGQKQRLALARALIRKLKVLICDEITSALDKENSRIIEEILLNNKELTVIMITHILQSEQDKFDIVISL